MTDIKQLTKLFILVMVMMTAVFGADSAQQNERVINKGIGGQNSREGKARFEKDVLTLKPNYVFIYFGLNDVLNEPKFLSEDEYIKNLTWMVEAARKAGMEPVVCTIHFVGEEALLQRHKKESYAPEGPNGKIKRYNTALRTWAVAQQVKIADFNKVVADATQKNQHLVSEDGVHLTARGYQALAQCFYDVVADVVKGKQTTIVCLGDSVTWGAGVSGSGTTKGETYPAYLKDMIKK